MATSSRLNLNLLIRGAILGAIGCAIAVGVVARSDSAGRVAGAIGGSLGVVLGLLVYQMAQRFVPGRSGRVLAATIAGIMGGLVLSLFVPEMSTIAPLAGLLYALFIEWLGLLVGGLLASVVSGLIIGALASVTSPGRDLFGGALSGVVINLLFGTVGVLVVWVVDKILTVLQTYLATSKAEIEE